MTRTEPKAERDWRDLAGRLGERLAKPLPPESIRAQQAPALSYGRHFGPAAHDARAAAVSVLLYVRQHAWHVPFTARPATMLAHAGQVSFPGGTLQPGESTREAAVRELREELGVSPQAIEVVGNLSSAYVFASNFQVTPWVAVARTSLIFEPCSREVAEILEIPVSYLMDSASYGQHQFRRGELEFNAPHLLWGNYRVWGATAIILAELVEIVRELPGEIWQIE